MTAVFGLETILPRKKEAEILLVLIPNHRLGPTKQHILSPIRKRGSFRYTDIASNHYNNSHYKDKMIWRSIILLHEMIMLRIGQRRDDQDKPLILALYITQYGNQQNESLLSISVSNNKTFMDSSVLVSRWWHSDAILRRGFGARLITVTAWCQSASSCRPSISPQSILCFQC